RPGATSSVVSPFFSRPLAPSTSRPLMLATSSCSGRLMTATPAASASWSWIGAEVHAAPKTAAVQQQMIRNIFVMAWLRITGQVRRRRLARRHAPHDYGFMTRRRARPGRGLGVWPEQLGIEVVPLQQLVELAALALREPCRMADVALRDLQQAHQVVPFEALAGFIER